MNACKLPFDAHFALPGGVKALLSQSHEITPFIQGFADHKELELHSSTRSYPAGRRKILVEVLENQHKQAHEAQRNNIRLLQKENCFTVCTGHQLNVFTGPAFFIYKIVHTLKLAKQLNAAFTDKHVVPVYWMASEDHDLAEINHLHTRSQRLEWHREAEGAVGRMSSQGLLELAQELLEGIDPGKQLPHRKLIEEAAQGDTLAEVTRRLVNGLFGQYGIVVIDADHRKLKQLFLPVLEAEVFHPVSADLIVSQSAALTKGGFSTPVNPRPINLFYLSDSQRDRIERTATGYKAGLYECSPEEMKELVKSHPERFSPNVVLRPLYQEYILPNLAYIGGAGELSYWLQLKTLFDHYETPFPKLILRNSAVFFTRREAELLDEIGLSYSDLFEDEHILIKRIVLDGEEEDPFFAESKAKLSPLYEAMARHLSEIDPTLEKRVLATWARHEKDIDGLEKSGIKALKTKNEITLNRLRKVREVVYPEGQFQERYLNFFQLEVLADGDLIEHLLETFDGLQPCIHVVSSSA